MFVVELYAENNVDKIYHDHIMQMFSFEQPNNKLLSTIAIIPFDDIVKISPMVRDNYVQYVSPQNDCFLLHPSLHICCLKN